jgi:hypothetical protein
MTPVVGTTPVERHDSGNISQLRSEDMTPVVYPDSGRTS